MKLAPSQLAGQLARGLAPAYAIAGEEPLLAVESLDAIRAAARKAGFDEREIFDADKSFDWQRLAEAGATGSLFAQRRILEVRLEASPNEEGAAILASLAERPPPDVLLILTAGKLEKTARASKWWMAFEKHAVAIYGWPVPPAEFAAWLTQRLRAAGFDAAPDALALLRERTEGNLLAAAQEIAKLQLLRGPGRLDAATITDAVADSAHLGVFEWIDRLLLGDAVGGVRGVRLLRQEGEELPPLLAALASDLRKLAAIAQAVARGENASSAVGAARVFGARQAAFTRAAARLRPPQVLRWLQQVSRMDRNAKSGQAERAWEDLLTLAQAVAGSPQRRRA